MSTTKSRWNLTFSLAVFVFVVMLSAVLIAGLVIVALHLVGVFDFVPNNRPARGGQHFSALIAMGLFSTFLGTAIAGFFSRRVLKPIRQVIDATHRVSEGDFDVRVSLSGTPELEDLGQSFNKMAQELAAIQTLRSDFINSMSHEFKTPIVSIHGFAKLLNDPNLTDAERVEYTAIIVSESERLASLSTNILNLSKLENLEIVGDRTHYRLDEQIRMVLVMTEPMWSAKSIDIDLALDEIMYEGNADLTQQIWINLIDNAIKFVDTQGRITLRLNSWNSGVRFTISDTGPGMGEQSLDAIFEKFYQGDPSRTQSGNGLGLSIVKRIVDLCEGTIEVSSTVEEGSEFSVWLPISGTPQD